MTPQQLLQQYGHGKRDFPWVDLQGADLSKQQLVGINFNRAKLAGADFRQTDLRQANFLKANLCQADLTDAQLAGCNFRKANLTGAKLDLSQVSELDLQGATLPDGTLAPTELAPTATVAPVDPTPAPSESPSAVSAHVLPHHLPVAAPRPKTWAEVQAVLPYVPLSLWGLGYFLAGLTLYLSLGHPLAWGLTLFAAMLWSLHEGMTGFVPILVGLAILLGSPITNAIGLGVAAVLTLMAFGGLWVSGWPFHKALHGALWFGGIAAVGLVLGTWLLISPGPMVVILSPVLPLAMVLLLALGAIAMGLTSLTAMDMACLSQRQQRWVMGATAWVAVGLGGGLGRLLGWWLQGPT